MGAQEGMAVSRRHKLRDAQSHSEEAYRVEEESI